MNAIERERLIDEYRQSLRLVRRAIERSHSRVDDRAEIDRSHLREMEAELVWVLEYLETGHVPDFRKGAYRWIVPVDPSKLRFMVKAVSAATGQADWVALDAGLDRLLSVLTPREREALVLVRGYNCSYREVARYMQVSDGTVSTLVRRAERKIRRASLRQFVAHPSQ